MTTKSVITVAAVVLIGYSFIALRADDQQPSTEDRLRQALRDTISQLRDAQNQVITLQATQAQSDKDNADLKSKVDALTSQVKALTDQAAADKAASDQTIANLKQGTENLVDQMVDTLTTQINSLARPGEAGSGLDKAIGDLKTQNPTLAKPLDQYRTDIQLWTTGYEQYVQFATKTESERARLALQAALLQRTVDDRERKNLALYQVGSDILTRYEKFSLGDALAAKEPFVGVTRVKLENLVQDYKNKLLDQTVISGQPVGPAPFLSSPAAAPSPNKPGDPPPVSGKSTVKA